VRRVGCRSPTLVEQPDTARAPPPRECTGGMVHLRPDHSSARRHSDARAVPSIGDWPGALASGRCNRRPSQPKFGGRCSPTHSAFGLAVGLALGCWSIRRSRMGRLISHYHHTASDRTQHGPMLMAKRWSHRPGKRQVGLVGSASISVAKRIISGHPDECFRCGCGGGVLLRARFTGAGAAQVACRPTRATRARSLRSSGVPT
jgi:hypothetical protein